MGSDQKQSIKVKVRNFPPFWCDVLLLRVLEFILSQNARVLMVGAGGIGCELLKTLALSGFEDIHIV